MNKFGRHFRFSNPAMLSVWVFVLGLYVCPTPSSAANDGDSSVSGSDKNSREQVDLIAEEVDENRCSLFDEMQCYCCRDEDDPIYVPAQYELRLPKNREVCLICKLEKCHALDEVDNENKRYVACRFCGETFHRQCVESWEGSTDTRKSCVACTREDWKTTESLYHGSVAQKELHQKKSEKEASKDDVSSSIKLPEPYDFIHSDRDYLIGNRAQRGGVCIRRIVATLGWVSREDVVDFLTWQGFDADDQLLLLPCCCEITSKHEYERATSDCSSRWSTIDELGQCPNFRCESRRNSSVKPAAVEFPELRNRCELKERARTWECSETGDASFIDFISRLDPKLRLFPHLGGCTPSLFVCGNSQCARQIVPGQQKSYAGTVEQTGTPILVCHDCAVRYKHDVINFPITDSSSRGQRFTIKSLKKINEQWIGTFRHILRHLKLVFIEASYGKFVGFAQQPSGQVFPKDLRGPALCPDCGEFPSVIKDPDPDVEAPTVIEMTLISCFPCGRKMSQENSFETTCCNILCCADCLASAKRSLKGRCPNPFCRGLRRSIDENAQKATGRVGRVLADIETDAKTRNREASSNTTPPSADSCADKKCPHSLCRGLCNSSGLSRIFKPRDQAEFSPISSSVEKSLSADAKRNANPSSVAADTGQDAEELEAESQRVETADRPLESSRSGVKLLSNHLGGVGPIRNNTWKLRVLDETQILDGAQGGPTQAGMGVDEIRVSYIRIEVAVGYRGDNSFRLRLEVVANSGSLGVTKVPSADAKRILGESLSRKPKSPSSTKERSAGVAKVTVGDVKNALQTVKGLKDLDEMRIQHSTFYSKLDDEGVDSPTIMQDGDIVSASSGLIYIELANQVKLREAVVNKLKNKESVDGLPVLLPRVRIPVFVSSPSTSMNRPAARPRFKPSCPGSSTSSIVPFDRSRPCTSGFVSAAHLQEMGVVAYRVTIEEEQISNEVEVPNWIFIPFSLILFSLALASLLTFFDSWV